MFLAFLAGSFNDLSAQGRKKEVRNQRRAGSLFKRKSSAGNADAFARGGRRGKGKTNTAWVYKHKKVSKKQHKENRFLFSRYRTKGKRRRDGIIAKQNASRAKRRVRGNKVFHKRKF